MSIISDAILQNLMSEGMPIIILPATTIKKKDPHTDQEIPDDIEILPTRLTKPEISRGMFTPVIPSPVPG